MVAFLTIATGTAYAGGKAEVAKSTGKSFLKLVTKNGDDTAKAIATYGDDVAKNTPIYIPPPSNVSPKKSKPPTRLLRRILFNEPEAVPCYVCKGSGIYHGILISSTCKNCKGTGQVIIGQ